MFNALPVKAELPNENHRGREGPPRNGHPRRLKNHENSCTLQSCRAESPVEQELGLACSEQPPVQTEEAVAVKKRDHGHAAQKYTERYGQMTQRNAGGYPSAPASFTD